jgi:hypothetical protein
VGNPEAMVQKMLDMAGSRRHYVSTSAQAMAVM